LVFSDEDESNPSMMSREIVVDLTKDIEQSDNADNATTDDGIMVEVAVDESAMELEVVSDFFQLPTIEGVHGNYVEYDEDLFSDDDETCYSEDDVIEDEEPPKPRICMLRCNSNRPLSNGNRIRFGGIPLIWDTGASDHVFDLAPPGTSNFGSINNSILLGGSTQHEVIIRNTFDIGFLKTPCYFLEKLGLVVVSFRLVNCATSERFNMIQTNFMLLIVMVLLLVRV
jgi:hypothetical protein